MNLELVQVPNFAAWALMLVLLAALLTHLLARSREKRPVRLSAAERELLAAARGDGEILLLRACCVGEWVRAGGIDFADDNDPARAAYFVEALRGLEMRGLAVNETGDLYRLTGSGFAVARSGGEK